MKPKVLLLLDHAPNYREAFLRVLAQNLNLTVVAHSCSTGNLTPPKERLGYKYYELVNAGLLSNFYSREFTMLIKNNAFDVLCIALNVRYPYRFVPFMFDKSIREKWIWWGQILGRSNNLLLLKIKKNLIKRSKGGLTYSEKIVKDIGLQNIYSFNNSQYSISDYVKLENSFDGTLKCLFVGRPQERKKLELLFDLAKINNKVKFRLVGPGMEEYFEEHGSHENIEVYGAASGNQLLEHFKWSNIVINPGHVGLLVMNAACHNRSIIINSSVNHAPEVILAKESNQFFVDFSNLENVSNLFNELIDNSGLMNTKAEELFNKGKESYNIEYMAKIHKDLFYKTVNILS